LQGVVKAANVFGGREACALMELICGVDEAGRGPLAGPVTAAAVILPPDFPLELLADSKALSAGRRRKAEAMIKARAVAWGIGWASHNEIDELNILRATLLAMRRAVDALPFLPDRLLVDGLHCPSCGIPATAVVRGDASEPAIMAASIIAKTARDAWMESYAPREPAYRFEKHKGYPTAEHRRIISRLGPSAIQRRTFRITCP
jgi:ribonuclease HII